MGSDLPVEQGLENPKLEGDSGRISESAPSPTHTSPQSVSVSVVGQPPQWMVNFCRPVTGE